MAEKKDIAYRIYQAKAKVSVFDLLYEYGISYTALKPILDELVENKVLATEDGKYYKFIGDGRMFSGKHKKEQLKHFDNEQEKELQERRAYLEARRQALIKMLTEQDENDGEDTAEHNDDDEAALDEAALLELRMAQKMMFGGSCIEGEDEDEDNDPNREDDLCKLVLKNITEGIAVNERDSHYFIEIKGIELCETDAKFEFLPCDGEVYLCDQGATFCSLGETVELNDEVREEAKRIAAESGAKFIDEKLCVKVGSAEQTLASLFRLYAAMERVFHIGDALPRKEEKAESSEEEAEPPEEYIRALEHVVRSNKASFIGLHAKFGFAFDKIGLMFEWMEKEGFITSFNSATKKREVLLTLEEFMRRFGKK